MLINARLQSSIKYNMEKMNCSIQKQNIIIKV